MELHYSLIAAIFFDESVENSKISNRRKFALKIDMGGSKKSKTMIKSLELHSVT